MNFRLKVKCVMMARRQGWYATRQHMLKNKASMQEVANVLVLRLRQQGIENKLSKRT